MKRSRILTTESHDIKNQDMNPVASKRPRIDNTNEFIFECDTGTNELCQIG